MRTVAGPPSVASPGSESYSARQLRAILVFALLGTLFDGAELNLVGYPLSYIASTLHVSTLALVSVTTLQGIASIAGGLLFGWLGDTLGRRRTYAACVLAFGVAAALGGLAPNYPVFLLTRLLAGVGMGGLFGLSFSLFAEAWTTTRRGAMGGAIQAMYYVGEIVTEGVLFVCLVRFGHVLGWRAGYVALGVGSIVVGLAALRLLPESLKWLDYQQQLRAGTLQTERRRSSVPLIDALRPEFAFGTAVFVVVATAMFLTTNSLTAYLSTYLLKDQHLPLGTASLIVLFGYVCTMTSFAAAGALSDAIRRKYAYLCSCVFGLVGFGWFAVQVVAHLDHVGAGYWESPTFWALMMCAGAAGGFGVLGVWMSEFFPTRIRASGSNGSYYVGRGLGAGVFPLFALTIAGTVPMALALGIVGPAAGILFSALAPDRTGRTITSLD